MATAAPRIVLAGGTVVTGDGSDPVLTDVALEGGRVASIGSTRPLEGDEIVECSGRMVLPGMIDAHSHADSAVFDPQIQHALLRQGVTTVIGGQDGISFAPGDGRYCSDYFAVITPEHPTYRGHGVADLLRTYDGTTPVNVGYMLPAGTIRFEVMGWSTRRASTAEIGRMQEHVRIGLAEGALGLSSGLDYVPGLYADTEELLHMCHPVADAGALYLSHMRGGYEENSRVGTDEITRICLATGVSAQISHFHARAALARELVDEMRASGVDVTYDAYPYRRGSTLLSMLVLPPELRAQGAEESAAAIRDDSALRARLLGDWFPRVAARADLGQDWPDNVLLSSIDAPGYDWAIGRTLREAATSARTSPPEFALDILAAAQMNVLTVIKVPQQRSYDDLASLFTHPAHVGGSDGVYRGDLPHPRGWGCFAKYLSVFVVERGDYLWQDAAWHLAGHTAARFGLADRGVLRPGAAGDVIVVDPATVGDNARYRQPKALASGIDDVFVNGQHVLAGGELTGRNAGRGLRRTGRTVRDIA